MTILLLINLHDDTRQLGKVMENIANSSIRYYFALESGFHSNPASDRDSIRDKYDKVKAGVSVYVFTDIAYTNNTNNNLSMLWIFPGCKEIALFL